MPVTTRTLTVQTLDLQDQPAPNARISIRLNRVDADADGIVVPVTNIEAVADEYGLAEIPLWPNALGSQDTRYLVTIRNAAGNLVLFRGRFYMPDADSHLSSLLSLGAIGLGQQAQFINTVLGLLNNAGSGLKVREIDLSPAFPLAHPKMYYKQFMPDEMAFDEGDLITAPATVGYQQRAALANSIPNGKWWFAWQPLQRGKTDYGNFDNSCVLMYDEYNGRRAAYKNEDEANPGLYIVGELFDADFREGDWVLVTLDNGTNSFYTTNNLVGDAAPIEETFPFGVYVEFSSGAGSQAGMSVLTSDEALIPAEFLPLIAGFNALKDTDAVPDLPELPSDTGVGDFFSVTEGGVFNGITYASPDGYGNREGFLITGISPLSVAPVKKPSGGAGSAGISCAYPLDDDGTLASLLGYGYAGPAVGDGQKLRYTTDNATGVKLLIAANALTGGSFSRGLAHVGYEALAIIADIPCGTALVILAANNSVVNAVTLNMDSDGDLGQFIVAPDGTISAKKNGAPHDLSSAWMDALGQKTIGETDKFAPYLWATDDGSTGSKAVVQLRTAAQIMEGAYPEGCVDLCGNLI